DAAERDRYRPKRLPPHLFAGSGYRQRVTPGVDDQRSRNPGTSTDPVNLTNIQEHDTDKASGCGDPVFMCVHLVGDNIATLSTLRGMLEKRYTLTSELLGHADLRGKDIQAPVVAADLRDVDNITALKEISPKLSRIPKRIFLIDRKSRLSTVQA